ncbi:MULTISPECIES: aspartyl-phosphate phosphatase Spo0E family protein [Bacillaceae]|jgi:stage 0 sporulation regulatory protein|nr:MULTISPECIES: aspartyl-phosphate phosphatase Spo0E family protein [Bacillaceae]MDF2065691.1 aspartyl-phosphate phosphatase Spo0E family protein [Bacillus sp. Cr_A10]
MVESILKQVEFTREKMIQTAIEKGMQDQDTIRLSKELDLLLNIFQYEESQNIQYKK